MNKPIRHFPFFLIFLLFLSAPVWAQESDVHGFNLQNYAPGVDPFSIWSTNTTKMLTPGRSFFLIDTNYSGGQFDVTLSSDNHKILDKIVSSNLLYTLGITDFVSVGVDVNLYPWTRSVTAVVPDPDLTDDPYRFQPESSFTIGDTRLYSKWRVIKDKPHSWVPGLGILAYTTLPSGNENRFLGWQGSTVGGTLLIDKSSKLLSVAANVGYQSIPQKTAFDITVDDRVTYSLGVSVPTTAIKGTVIDFMTELNGSTQATQQAVVTSPLEYRTGLRLTSTHGLGATAGGGASLNNSLGNPDYRVLLGFFWKQPDKKRIASSQFQQTVTTLNPTIAFDPVTNVRQVFMTTVAPTGPVLTQAQMRLVQDLAQTLAKETTTSEITIEMVGRIADTLNTNTFHRHFLAATQIKAALRSRGIPEDKITLRHRTEDLFTPTAPLVLVLQ